MTLVFVYGTLMSTGTNPASEYAGAEVIDKGWTIGRLYNLGWYPGFRPEYDIDAAVAPKVWGELIHVSEDGLARLDGYEGYPFLYDRQEIFVHTETGVHPAWVYTYVDEDRLTPDLVIPSGKWMERI